MAIVTSDKFTQMSGKSGGGVYVKGKYGRIILRGYKNPVNPKTPAQTTVREAFAHASGYWRELTDDQRQAWKSWASTVTRYDRLENPYTPSGQQEFIRRTAFMYRMINTGLPPFDGLGMDYDAPKDPGDPPDYTVTAVQAPTTGPCIGLELAMINNTAWNCYFATHTSPAQSAAVDFYRSPFFANTLQAHLHDNPGGSLLIPICGMSEGYNHFVRVAGLEVNGNHSRMFITKYFNGIAVNTPV
jgi:hypothetical protein